MRRIREVNFPTAVIEAHRAGKLVIFVGAGASLDVPANLPGFRALTVSIAAEAQVEATNDELDHPDVFLGKLVDRQVDVHRRVAAHIGVPTSKPNRLHTALGELAVTGGPVRIVTTNYDLHLSTVLSGLHIQVEEYVGPALPMGDDFTGVVYLHGSLRQEPRHLVVTDRDFGRAYLRDAWAARFLERMFATYTVLFVGYSHGDVVMRYLARALVPGASRYVLTSTPDALDWRPLGLCPIGYPVVGGSHAALVDAIERWAFLASMGLLDHRQLILDLVSVPPSQVPEEASYLEAVIADPEQVRLFAELARGEEWLAWAAAQSKFRRLFEPSAPPTGCTLTLADWFAAHYVMDEVLTPFALGVMRAAGGRMGPTLWSAIGRHMHRRGPPRSDWLGPWLVLLIQNATQETPDWLEYALVASRWPDDRPAALLLFDHLTEPQVQTVPSSERPGGLRFDIRLRGSRYWLDEAWKLLFVANLAEAAPAVLAIADRHLRRAFQLLAAAGFAGPGWDPVSFRRSSVDLHPQDRHREAVDVLIDAARDCLETLLNAGDALGESYAIAWADSEVPILRRLGLHGWIHRTDLDGTAKIAWLRERGWLFDYQLRHEVFRLIEVALPSAAGEVADGLVADALAGPDNAADEDHRAYQQFNVLAWIKRHAPNLQSALRAFEQVQAQNPNFAEREHPDLLSRMEFGSAQPRPPMTVQELHERINANTVDAVAELRRYENISFPSEGLTWDALSVLVETVRDQPLDGFAVLDAIGGDHPDIVNSVISGWSAAVVDAGTAEAILQRLARVDLVVVAEVLSRLLGEVGQSDTNPTKWFLFPAARRLATDLWSAIGTAPPAADIDDWLGRALSSAAGRLVLFWVHAVAADWREAGDQWTGIPSETQAQLEVLLASDDARSALAEVMLASKVQFFFDADRGWCEDHVLPLLGWTDQVRAQRTWSGYLTRGRWNDQLLTAGMLENYRAAAIHFDVFREDLRRQLCSHLARVALFSELDPLPWMKSLTADVEDTAQRVEWMNQVTWMLNDLPANAVEHQWQRWMQQYWRGRLDSIPLQLTADEASAMAAWVVYLTDSIGEGVALATAHPAGLREHSRILHKMDNDRIHRAPAEFTKLIAHLTQGTQPPFWDCRFLANILPRLRNGADPADINTIIGEAIRLGCHNATQW